MTVLDRRFVYFSSRDTVLVSSNPSSFKMIMDGTMFSLPQDGVYFRIFINSAVLRNDFSDISNTNSVLYKDGVQINLKQGKPKIEDVVTDLATHGIICSYDPDTNYLTFHTNTPYTLDFTNVNSCAEVLGFVENNSYVITDGYQPPNDVYLGEHDVIYIQSSLPTRNFEVVAGDSVYSRVMCFIPNLSQPYEILNHADSVGEQAIVERERKVIQEITFTLTDTNVKGLQLNSPWWCSVCIEYLTDTESDILKALGDLNNKYEQLLSLERRRMIMDDLKEKAAKKKHKGSKK